MRLRQTEHQWAADKVEPLPHRWQGRILAAWERARQETPPGEPHRAANLALLDVTTRLSGHRMPLDATDETICGHADEQARRCFDVAALYQTTDLIRAAMGRIVQGQGIMPPGYRIDKASGEMVPMRKRDGTIKMQDGPAIKRMTCPIWWRRALRKVHAKQVEGAAIVLGLVHRAADPYVSAESLTRRQQQHARNQAALEATIARNDVGQEYTLAELAATGTANKAIRRAELMTRISGFERIARDMQHAGLFWTMTCPSRMHKWRTVKGGRVVENRRYDGTTPRQAQSYLATVWARIRAALKRAGIGMYGFRIAEPQHDGTPHWHLLTFHEPEHADKLRAIISKQALKDSPNEPGAALHRVDYKPIDWARGTAAGYIAKYVAKNIDGYRLDKDLIGGDALETAARVEAWAATWGIRQFQQVGGPPVGPWRELRRVESIPAQAPEHLKAAHRAVNKLALIEGRENASVAWDHYCKAQGGVFCGRGYSIRISTVDNEEIGRYGEQKPATPVGVETVGIEFYRPAHMAHMKNGLASRMVTWIAESTRHRWEIVTRSAGRLVSTGPKAPWTCVNNCTDFGYEAAGTGTASGTAAGRGEDAGSVGYGPGIGQNHGGHLRGATHGSSSSNVAGNRANEGIEQWQMNTGLTKH